jgi:hypothetical protein
MLGLILLWVGSIVIGALLTPKLEKPKAATLEDFDFPTASDGRAKPIIFGTVKLTSPNNVWYGDLSTEKIKEWANKITGKKATVGYKYKVGMHNIACLGRVDELKKIYFDDQVAWSGSVTSNSTIYVSAGNLFGGKNKEGGVSGYVDVEFGGASQAKNTYLTSKIGSTIPAYRNQLGLVFKSFYIGNSPYIKPVAFELKRTDIQTDGTAQWNPTKANISGDMNPIHVIRECLVSKLFGMGEPTSKIDDASFTAAANTIYTEGLGVSFVYDKSEKSISRFIADIKGIIDCSLYIDLSDGKYYVKLIRDDYDAGTLQTYGEDDIVEITELTRPGATTLPNEIKVNYTSRTENYARRVSSTINIANVNAQGRRVPEAFDYYGVMNSATAAILTAREAKQASAGLFKATIVGNRSMLDLNQGDTFKLSWPAWGIESVIVRVLNVDMGSLLDNKVTIDVVEDIFGINNSIYAAPEDTDWTEPIEAPVDNEDAVLIDMPYFEQVLRVGETTAQNIIPGIAYGICLAPRSQGQAIGYDSWIDYGAGYTYQESASFTPFGTIDQSLNDSTTDLNITLIDFVELENVDPDSVAYSDGEFFKVKSVNAETGAVVLARGALDTVPISHTTGNIIFFLSGAIYSETNQLAISDSYNQKLLTETSDGILAISGATAYPHTLLERINTPYPPADFQISDTGDIDLTWKTRTRLNGYDIAEQSDAAQTGEVGQTDTVTIIDGVTTVRTITGITSDSYSYTEALQRTDFGLNVTGTTTPDVTGDYAEAGTNDGKPYYQKGADYNWWNTANAKWYISGTVGSVPVDGFELANADPEGTYTAIGTATGSPVVIINRPELTIKLKSVRNSIDSYTEWSKVV